MTNTVKSETKPQETESKSQTTSDSFADLGENMNYRCDACGAAQAFAMATKDNYSLFFCGHHHNAHAPALGAQGWDIVDRTDLINQKPSTSANV